ncbi:cupin domain-containing protein [Croceicoccus sp. F390]|uniref:Cupin domain-containing protein n=1 Tax=Croceicoccus esteveae TaxID=3075597 RepID=A0ABU2ZG92_9SPHN|nr:cupin domain-containing protein [Croceicoccus sp. F390]MDT0575608.1 cupin domain-containing protein [Croceicoccus sp. F390]
MIDPERFDSAAFLRDSWQKSPVLIRNPWHAWANPLQPDELAGLSCECLVEARLVTQRNSDLHLEHGPFAEGRFADLPARSWTLLVQAVDHHVPAVATLLDSFRFIPDWRIDDVMVSYAADGGGVGPHFDNYDVFLIQGLGRRRWQLGEYCNNDVALQPHDDLRLLREFRPTQEWVLEPGDILYVPPRLAHNGVAIGDDCMTYSIGFRAPSRAELIEEWTDEVLMQLADDDRYTDPDLTQQANAGEIAPAAVARLHELAIGHLLDATSFLRWFGRYSTRPADAGIDWRPEQAIDARALHRHVDDGAAIIRNPASRFSFVRQTPSSVLLFVDGQCHSCAGDVAVLAERLCGQKRLKWSQITIGGGLSAPGETLLVELFNQGSIGFDDGEDGVEIIDQADGA